MSAAQSESIDISKEAPETASKVTGRHIIAGIVTAIVLCVGAFYGIRHIQFVLAHEETDDAQVEGHISPVLPRVSGYVSKVLVDDNQHVNAGDLLVQID